MHDLIRVGLIALTVAVTSVASAQDRETKVRNDRKSVEESGYWIYNDLPRGFAEAKETGKPLLVALRCIPCEACAQLDAQIVDRDPVVNKLLDQFVCLRIVHANGLDLSLFQFDYDQSFAAFFLNADGTIYGRYGTRSHETESENDVSVEGFARALEGALDLHRKYPEIKPQLSAKYGSAPLHAVPEAFPFLKGRFGSKLDYDGNVVKSCIHCHQVGEATRLAYRDKGEAILDEVLFPYPMPNLLGLTMDPKQKARIREVAANSSAEKDGFRAGDDIATIAGQPLLSIADIQWVLHRARDADDLPAVVIRNGKSLNLSLTLRPGWRQKGDISWRAGSWDLRRMTTGGMRLDDMSTVDRRTAGLADDVLALGARYVPDKAGTTGHGAARQAGFQKGDILIEIDGQSNRLTESQWMTWLVNARKVGDRIKVSALRDGKRLTFELPMQ